MVKWIPWAGATRMLVNCRPCDCSAVELEPLHGSFKYVVSSVKKMCIDILYKYMLH